MQDDSYIKKNGQEAPGAEDHPEDRASGNETERLEKPKAEDRRHPPLPLEAHLPSFLQEDHLTPLLDDDKNLEPDAQDPSATDSGASGLDGLTGPAGLTSLDGQDESAGIPWRGMPSIASDEPLPLGVLDDEDGDDSELEEGIVTMSAEQAQELVFDEECGECPEDDPDDDSDDDSPPDPDRELVLGVKFRQYGPVYFFRAGHEKIRPGGKVLVETEQGVSLANVISARKMRLPLPKLRTAEGENLEIKGILGLAGPEDIAAAADNQILASTSRLFCKECIRKRNLDMKLVDVEVLHDRSKIIFYFTAPTRIDFRDLVKDLVRNYRTRIELRQIGVRHETQMIGALGNCGMTCCCRRYLRRFAPVTIKMAKEQNLFLNPAKLSGICGRLLCCLSYEQENYEEFHKKSPKLGKKYQTVNGIVRVLRANLFRQSIVVLDEGGNETEMQLDEWQALDPKRMDQSAAQAGHGAAQGGKAGAKPRREGQGRQQEEDKEAGRDAGRQRPPQKGQDGKKAHAQESPRPGRATQERPEDEDVLAGADESVFERQGSGRVYPAGFNEDAERLKELAAQPQDSGDDEFEDEAGEADGEGADGSIFGLPGSKYNKP